jgi:hypothetical protein
LRDQALRRVGELPRQQVAPALYGLFTHKNWKVRWVAAELVLKMSEVVHLDEFMNKLGGLREMAITEPIRYGKLIAGLPGSPPARDVIARYAERGRPAPVRLTALGYYLDQGTQDQLATLEGYSADGTRVPGCGRGAEGCEWRCEVSNAGQQVPKEISTVGDFVQYCVKPAVLARVAALAPAAKGGAEATAKN